MEFLKKIVQEEIQKALTIISENEYRNSPSFDVFEKSQNANDAIIYNYELGREFANNTLQVDIDNLNRYNLSEYLPKSINQEKWSFEFVTTTASTLIIDISKEIRGGKTYWTLMFGILYKGEVVPDMKDMIEDVLGYDNFVKAVNSNIAKKFDPSKL